MKLLALRSVSFATLSISWHKPSRQYPRETFLFYFCSTVEKPVENMCVTLGWSGGGVSGPGIPASLEALFSFDFFVF